MAEIKDCCSCIYANRSTFTEPCVSCGVDFKNYAAKPTPKRKRKTNADLIRAMTDEELSVILAMQSEISPPWCTAKDVCPYIDQDPARCDLCALEWLQQEAET